jgi:hypothetical protein
MGGFDWVFSLARVVATSLEGAKRVLLANVEGIEGETANKQLVYSALGWFGRPLPPDANGAADALCARVEDGLIPFAMRDPRLSVKTNAKNGELGIAHYDGGFISLKRNAASDGTDVTIYAPKADGSKASVISIDTTDANSNITLMHDSGVSVQLADGKVVIYNEAGDAYIEVNSGGVTINGNVKVNGGMTLGTPAAGSLVLEEPFMLWAAEVATATGVPVPTEIGTTLVKAS